MANGLNQCNFLGNLGADPELRYTQSGRAILKFRIACSEPRKQQDGSYGEHVEWVPVVIWGRRAEGLGKFLSKGHTVFVSGKMRTTKYQDRNGDDRWRTEINAEEVIVTGGGGGGNRNGDGGQRRATRRPQNEQGQSSGGGGGGGGGSYPDEDYGPSGEDDDIPF